jgi:hypothetical protein
MKNIFILSLVLLTAACTPQQNSKNQPADPTDQVVILEAKSGILSGTTDFGTYEEGATSTKLITFSLKNTGDEPLVGPAVIDDSTQGFSVSYSNCPASLAKTKSCTIKVVFNARNLSAGEKAANLNFDSVYVNMTATINAPVLTPSVDYLVSSAVVTSLDYGQLTTSQSVLKTITVKNTGPVAINETVTIPSDFTVTYNTCSGRSLAKGASCSLKINLSGAGKSGVISGDVVYAGKTLALTGEVLSPASFSNVVMMNGSTQITSYDFGSLSGTASKQLILTIKNIGTGAAAAASASLSNTDFSIVFNQCNNVSLAPNASCQVRVLFSASGKAANSYSGALNFGDKSLSLSAAVTVPQRIVTINRPAQGEILKMISSGFYDGSTFCGASGSGHDSCTINAEANGTVSLVWRGLPSNYANGTVSIQGGAGLSIATTAVANIDGAPGFEMVISGVTSSVTITLNAAPGAGSSFTVSNIALSADSKSFTVTGTGLSSVNSAKLLQTNQTEIDTLIIDSKTATQLILKPSKNLTLPAGDVIMRIQ